jgi:hypothetical protein
VPQATEVRSDSLKFVMSDPAAPKRVVLVVAGGILLVSTLAALVFEGVEERPAADRERFIPPRLWQVELLDKGVEAMLELFSRDASGVVVEQGGQTWRACPTVVPAQELGNSDCVPTPSELGFVEGSLELVGFGGCDVEECAGHGRRRDAVVNRHLVQLQRLRVEADAVALAQGSRRRHVEVAALRQQLPQNSGAPVAQDGILAAGEHGSHPSSPLRQARMPDGEDAVMHAVKSPRPHTALNRSTTEAKGDQLRMANDSVLPHGDTRNERIDRVRLRFVSHSDSKCRSVPNPPP